MEWFLKVIRAFLRRNAMFVVWRNVPNATRSLLRAVGDIHMCIWPRCEQIETKKTCLHVAYLHWIIGFTIVLKADHVRQLYWNAEHGVLVRCWLRIEFVRFGSSQHGSCIAIYHIYSLLNTFYTINYTVNGKGIFARNEKFTRAIFSVNVFFSTAKLYTRWRWVKWSERRSISDVIAYYFACIFCCCI